MEKFSKRPTNQIIKLLKEGDDLPEDNKHILFPPERREYELAYGEKEREEDVLTETMGVPRQPKKDFGKKEKPAWNNMLIFGDSLQIMKTLYK